MGKNRYQVEYRKQVRIAKSGKVYTRVCRDIARQMLEDSFIQGLCSTEHIECSVAFTVVDTTGCGYELYFQGCKSEAWFFWAVGDDVTAFSLARSGDDWDWEGCSCYKELKN